MLHTTVGADAIFCICADLRAMWMVVAALTLQVVNERDGTLLHYVLKHSTSTALQLAVLAAWQVQPTLRALFCIPDVPDTTVAGVCSTQSLVHQHLKALPMYRYVI